MNRITDAIRQLTTVFPDAEMKTPATDSAIDAFSRTYGPLPDGLVSFLRVTDGIDLQLSDDVVGKIYGLDEMRGALSSWNVLRELRLVPLRGDGCGNYDCLDVGVGATGGAVLFWDHEVFEGPAYLLGGDFTGYIEMWTDHVTACFSPGGESKTAWPNHPWPFDEQWMRSRDAQADRLLRDPQLRARISPTADR